ncbi:mitogen-activated protein kinase kinase 3-like [Miscanthus floridulus]|uniref:mitogen-activated protein kinase kinase 3-like n=1 Tax=Miscanthus floridulus TaxID=154761 RepID=UPI0034580A31
MCEQLLSHPFIKRYAGTEVDLAAYVKSVVDPTERLKQIAEMLAIHYYLLFNGSDGIWHHMKTFYMEQSTLSFSGKVYVGQNDIFDSLSNIRKKLKGDRPREKIVHVVEKLHCRANGETGVAIRVSGSFIVGNQFLVCGDGIKAEGMPSMDELSIDIPSKRVGQFREQFIMQPGNLMSCYYISKQDLYIIQS